MKFHKTTEYQYMEEKQRKISKYKRNWRLFVYIAHVQSRKQRETMGLIKKYQNMIETEITGKSKISPVG